MSKKITIKEQDVEEPLEESRDEIVQQLTAETPAPEPPPPPATAAPAEPAQQKADCKMRMRELYKCEACGKYLTKKSLNYSHFKTCKGNPENQVAKPKKEQPSVDEYEPLPQHNQQPPPQQPPRQQYVPPHMSLYDQMRIGSEDHIIVCSDDHVII